MESTTAGKCVSPTSWSVLAFGNRLNKMPFFPWRRYKQFLEKPLMAGIGGFAFQYFCSDLSGAVQRQGYGVITFVPYIVMFSIMFAVSVFWWIIYGRRLESCQGLETLPRHRQDIQMNETQQPNQEIQRDETLQAGEVQMDQALQGFPMKREEFCSLMDYWFSTRLGEMARDEALGKMKQLVEIGNRRSRDISIESTADETRAVMNESLETSGDGSRRLSAGSIVDGTHNLAFPVLCPRATESNSQARSLSHDGLVLKIPQNVNVGELGEIYDVNLPGCRELHRRIEIGSKDGHLREFLASQILESLRMAWTLDKDSTIQLGSFAIFKYTDSGVKCWMLQEGWTPTIFDIHRSSRNFFEVLTGERANWTVRGVNLRNATLRVATTEKSENLTNSYHFKTENGVDVVLFKEPPSLPMFLDGVFISASNIVKVEEGVPLKLHSQAIKVRRAFWISVVDAFIPRPWTVGIVTILSLLFHYFAAWHFAIVLPIIVAAYVYLLHDLGPQQGGDLPVGGSTPLLGDSGSTSESSSTTHGQDKSMKLDSSIEEQVVTDGDPLPAIQGLLIVGSAVLGGRLTVCGQSINGTTLCMFQWVRHYPNGTVMYIEGAAQPEYTVTADDHNTMLAVECVPMDERNRRGELVNVFANDCKLITCDESLQNEIDRYNAIRYASFDVKFLVDGSLPEEYWESTLMLMWNSYKLKRNNTAKTVVISEEYMSDVSIQILVGHLSQCVIKSHEGRSYYLKFPSSRCRDVGVLTFRLFQKRALDGKQGSGKEAATGNRQQTGEAEESQCQSGDAKDEAFEVKKPQEHVSTNKNKYSTGISDGDFPFEGRTQSAEAFSSIPARMSSQSAVVDDLTKSDEPIDKQPSRVSSSSAVEEGFTTTDETIDKQGGELTVDSMFDPDHWSVDPITYETMCDPVKCNDGVTYDRWTIINNGIRRSPIDRSLTTFFIACDDVDVRRRLFRELPEQEVMFRRLRETYREKALQSARALDCEDAIEMLNNVLVWAPSDTECKTELDRVITLINEGSSSLDRQPQKSDEPIDKQPSRVSSPSAVEEGFTTTDEAIDKQGGGLPDKKGKEQKNLTELQVRLLKELKERGPTRTLELAKIVGLVKARDVNPSIYDLEKGKFVVKVSDTPPVWELKEPGMNETRR